MAFLLTQALPALALPAIKPDSTWMTNGPIRAVVEIGQVVYVGGQFTALCQVAGGVGACGAGDTIAVDNLAAIDATTGQPLGYDSVAHTTTFDHSVTGTSAPIVYDLAASPAGDRLFIGGQFAKVDGKSRKNVAAMDIDATGQGTLDTAFRAKLTGGRVFGLEASATRLYAGGTFTQAASQGTVYARYHLASIDYSGNVDPSWAPTVDASAGCARDCGIRELALAVDDGGASIFVTGDFNSIDGMARKTLAKLDAGGTGTPRSWTPGGFIGTNAFGYDLLPTDTKLYVAEGGSDFFALFDPVTGDMLAKTDTNGSVQAVALEGDTPIIGGHFRFVADNLGENCGTSGGTCAAHHKIAALDPANSYLADNSWNPSLDGDYHGAWSLLVDGTQLYIGGDYTAVSGVAQQYFARLS
ncbi:MAG: hypothetical protein HY240_01860 [Actinobacteria bacterium]|nr:hypothetical protein [Actinomycetota bacterium]